MRKSTWAAKIGTGEPQSCLASLISPGPSAFVTVTFIFLNFYVQVTEAPRLWGEVAPQARSHTGLDPSLEDSKSKNLARLQQAQSLAASHPTLPTHRGSLLFSIGGRSSWLRYGSAPRFGLLWGRPLSYAALAHIPPTPSWAGSCMSTGCQSRLFIRTISGIYSFFFLEHV